MAKASKSKVKSHKGAELTVAFDGLEVEAVAPDGMSSRGDGKDEPVDKKKPFRFLAMRVDFEQSQGPCSRCLHEIGTTGYLTGYDIVCSVCAEDIRRERDTRGAWWRVADG